MDCLLCKSESDWNGWLVVRSSQFYVGHASLGVAFEAESDSFLNPQSDVVYWFKIWVGTNQKVVGSDPWAFCAWLLTLFWSNRTVPIISRVLKYFWIKVSAKWLLTHSHKLLGCLILLQQCILVVTLFLVRRWGVRADALLKAWTALLLSPFATSLFPVCHQLTSCLHYFSVMSVGLWWVSVSFLEMTVSIGRPRDNGFRSSEMLSHGEWHMPCVCTAAELFCRSHSGICAFCQNVFVYGSGISLVPKFHLLSRIEHLDTFIEICMQVCSN